MLPKIKFKEMSLEDNIKIIKWQYFSNDGVLNPHDYVVRYYPELEKIDSNLPREEIDREIERVVTNHYNNNIDVIEDSISRYTSLWQEYNDKYFSELETYFNVNWPKDLDEIDALVGFIPVFPRYLDEYSFAIGPYFNEDKLIKTCAHETLHFMWFEKWKRIHPETPRREYDAPYLTWKYSEMVTDPILNNSPFKDMFNFKERSYDSFYDLEDNGTKVMDNLRKIYSKQIPVEEKINTGFDYINKQFSEEKSKEK